MSSVMTSSYRRTVSDHFEPQDDSDPAAQRRLRGLLEQIDYTAFASNREVVAQMLGGVDVAKFQRLAIAAAHARAAWVAEAVALSQRSHLLGPAEVARLAHLRSAFEELTEAYEAMRRMVERGYLNCGPAPAAPAP
ncbi:hypothetical protein [Phenylobacterium sp.]|uniref:hypothetical protein n=1 Tax=Phenylobacterium sp. TaxID=1871053 RepID=UPI0026046DC3|nr:hypothetical protein [Phenylobacterium sp.]